MPSIRPISELRNNANEISDFCRQTREPVYITRNGTGDMVLLNIEIMVSGDTVQIHRIVYARRDYSRLL